jgi:hypothetical protein
MEKKPKPKPKLEIRKMTFTEALCALQGEIVNPKKETQAYQYKYATLDSVWAVLRAPMRKYGFSVTQDLIFKEDPASVGVKTTVFHISGDKQINTFTVPIPRKDIQTIGSYATYLRRYTLMAFFGICPEDTDCQEIPKGYRNQKPSFKLKEKNDERQ